MQLDRLVKRVHTEIGISIQCLHDSNLNRVSNVSHGLRESKHAPVHMITGTRSTRGMIGHRRFRRKLEEAWDG